MNRGAHTIIAISLAATTSLAAAATQEFAPKFVWNASASAPIGLYLVLRTTIAVGDYVVVSPNPTIANLIDERRYVPPDIPFLKRVAALTGNEVCRKGAVIFIDGVRVAEALALDSRDRLLPNWQGCVVLRRDEVFLLNDELRSLDGRYFGATNNRFVIGKAKPVWLAPRVVHDIEQF